MLRMTRGRKTSLTLAATLLLACGGSTADDKTAGAKAKTPEDVKTISGLIVKVDKYQDKSAKAEKADAERWVVTVSTDVVWRDFVRDQAVAPGKAAKNSIDRAAAKGRKSVAKEGQPLDPDLVATARLDSKTKLEMRYRAATDEVTKGSKTPEGAAKTEEEADTAASNRSSSSSRSAAKPRPLTTKDLKPGLWVEIALRPGDPKHAQTVTVLQPVEALKVPAESAKPAK